MPAPKGSHLDFCFPNRGNTRKAFHDSYSNTRIGLPWALLERRWRNRGDGVLKPADSICRWTRHI